MQTRNALKIGIWIVIALAIIIFGTKYFQGVSLRGSYHVVAEFDRVDGLIPGNMAQTKGVRIGQVRDIRIDQDSGFVLVEIAINEGVALRKGAVASLSGLAALGDVRVEIDPGPLGNPPLPPGSRIPSTSGGDLLGDLSSQADTYLSKIETILGSVDTTTAALGEQIGNPSSDLRNTLLSLRHVSASMADVMESESDNLARMIENLESASSNLKQLTSTDSTGAGLRESLDEMNATLASVRSLTSNLDTLLTKMNTGNGTLGKLANDVALYNHMDSVAVNLNLLLEDFRKNPKRYLKELSLIDFL
jgi:phospholipid/cholesterol/gamma-HCH transport system substrate-binding protein